MLDHKGKITKWKDVLNRDYGNLKSEIRNYIHHFDSVRQCIKRYGTYPYPKYMVLEDRKLVYLEMPKVANCSIKGSMLRQNFPDDYSVQNESMKYTVHVLGKRYRDYYKFTFVRNPFERLVSCYESKYHKDKKMLGSPYMKELVYEYYLFGYLKKDRGFTNFVCRIALIPDAYKEHHFKPQTAIVYDADGKCRVDFVGKYEHLNEQFGRIISKYDLDELPMYNKTDHKNYMDYYNVFTARLAYFIYKEDIQRFGYEKEYKRLLKYVKTRKRHGGVKN